MMLNRFPNQVLLLSLLAISSSGIPRVTADEVSDAAAEVSTALDALFYKSGRSGTVLRQLLKPDQLRALLADGPVADKRMAAQLLKLYTATIPNLKKSKKFVAKIDVVHSATEAWFDVLPRLDLDQVLERIQSNRPAFKAISQQRVTATKEAVEEATRALEAHMSKNPVADGESWEEYLSWSEMKQQLTESPLPLGRIQQLLNRFYVNMVGLEAKPFVDFRAAMRAYMNAYYFANNPKTEELYKVQMDLLASKLEAYREMPSNDNAWAIGRLVGWLDRVDQAPLVRMAIRENFFAPNFKLQVSQNLLSSSEKITIEDNTEFTDVIMKAQVTGTSETKADVTLELVPHQGLAAIKVKINGIAITHSVARRSGVEVLSLATTTLTGEKTVFFGPLGLTSTPAIAKCSTVIKILDIKAPSETYRIIAEKNTTKNKVKMEELASRRAETMLTERMDEQSLEMLTKGAEGYEQQFRLPLIRKGGFPEEMNIATTSEAVTGELVQLKWNQVAAGISAPALSGSPDLAVRLHESFVRNFSEAVIGGYTLTDKTLEQLLKDMNAEVPEELKTDSGRESWSITFSTNQPVSLKVNDGELKFAIRGRQFTDGDRVIRQTIEIGATYKIEKTDAGSRLVRQGDVDVDFVGQKRLTATQIAFRTVMRRKFGALFKQEISTDGFTLPGRWENSGTMKISQLLADKGWLVLAWKLSKSGVLTATRP
jgi:hypothetical protein